MIKKALFGMGCFWGPQAFFNKLEGVVDTTVGYAGGSRRNPTYHDLGDHSEVILIEYDPEKISYDQLLDHFFAKHNPTRATSNQYRSVILYFNKEQQEKAESKLAEIEKGLDKKVITAIEPANGFYKAENYHQNYLEKNK
jgi:methionine-S-sulfoxide reductase